MATVTSVGSGDWATGATWNTGSAPALDDTVVIDTGHTVTIAAAITAAEAPQHINVYGNLVQNADMVLNEKINRGLIMMVSGTYTSNGTPTAPRIITSSGGANPTYRWAFAVTTGATRALAFDNTTFLGSRWGINNSAGTRVVQFNFGGYGATAHMDIVPPMERAQIITEHDCDGRSYGRVYRNGGAAGVVRVSGYLSIAGRQWAVMQAMRDAGDGVCFTTDDVHMPRALIEDLRFGKPKGLYIPFTLTLIEDR